jgi:hypothetical protein
MLSINAASLQAFLRRGIFANHNSASNRVSSAALLAPETYILSDDHNFSLRRRIGPRNGSSDLAMASNFSEWGELSSLIPSMTC